MHIHLVMIGFAPHNPETENPHGEQQTCSRTGISRVEVRLWLRERFADGMMRLLTSHTGELFLMYQLPIWGMVDFDAYTSGYYW